MFGSSGGKTGKGGSGDDSSGGKTGKDSTDAGVGYNNGDDNYGDDNYGDDNYNRRAAVSGGMRNTI